MPFIRLNGRPLVTFGLIYLEICFILSGFPFITGTWFVRDHFITFDDNVSGQIRGRGLRGQTCFVIKILGCYW